MLPFSSSFRTCLGSAIRSGVRTLKKRFTGNYGIGEFSGDELPSFCPKLLTGRVTPSKGLCRMSAVHFSSSADASNPAWSAGKSDGAKSLLENFEKESRRRQCVHSRWSSSNRQVAEVARAHSLHLHGFYREYSNSSGQTIEMAERAATERGREDMLLSSPGAISADIETQSLFIADTNHHRVIIADADGKIVDCIGSSPGMEDGPFETAQLCSPACTVFDADRNSLYIADSENHVVRRADLTTRLLSTIEPPKVNSESSIWGIFSRWTAVSQPIESAKESRSAGKYNFLRKPWHLKFTQEGFILVASRWFENIWALDASSGEVTEYQFQDSEVLSEEFCRLAIDGKEMEDVYSLLLHEMKGNKSTVENPWQISSGTDLVSRVVRLDNKLFFADTEGDMIRHYNLDTGTHGTFHLSNLGLLGLPFWWSLPSTGFQSPNLLNKSDNSAQSLEGEAVRLDNAIHIRPGRCLLCINPVLPGGVVLAAPVEDGSIWRQAKGSVVELSMFGGSLLSHKISSAQQWMDDLDDLDDPNPDTQPTEELTLPVKSESGIPLYILLDASLGAGEVSVDAVLYLRRAFPQESGAELSGAIQGTDLEEWALQRTDKIYLRHLQIKVSLEVSTSAPEERTKHISVPLRCSMEA